MCFYAIYFHLWVRREGGNLIFITDALDVFFYVLVVVVFFASFCFVRYVWLLFASPSMHTSSSSSSTLDLFSQPLSFLMHEPEYDFVHFIFRSTKFVVYSALIEQQNNEKKKQKSEQPYSLKSFGAISQWQWQWQREWTCIRLQCQTSYLILFGPNYRMPLITRSNETLESIQSQTQKRLEQLRREWRVTQWIYATVDLMRKTTIYFNN